MPAGVVHEVYGMAEIGRLAAAMPDDSNEDPDTLSKGICPSSEDPSRFASKAKLIKSCTMVAKGMHDRAVGLART